MGLRSLAGWSTKEGRGTRAVWSWIARHSYHLPEQNVKDKKLYHRVKGACGRSAFSRRFESGEGRGQHAFRVARPLVQLCLGLAPPPGRELFHIPDFRHPRAAPARLQAVG